MNKEIEAIINHYINNDVARDKVKDYIEELKKKINTYEEPEDLTLMFMYCDEKAKDKIKELQNKIHTLEDELNWYKQECDDLEMRIGLDE